MERGIRRTRQFRRDVKRMLRRGKDPERLFDVVRLLLEGRTLETRHRDHALSGEYSDCRECHIEPDWLLIYMIDDVELVLVRTGSHADLFE